MTNLLWPTFPFRVSLLPDSKSLSVTGDLMTNACPHSFECTFLQHAALSLFSRLYWALTCPHEFCQFYKRLLEADYFLTFLLNGKETQKYVKKKIINLSKKKKNTPGQRSPRQLREKGGKTHQKHRRSGAGAQGGPERVSQKLHRVGPGEARRVSVGRKERKTLPARGPC